MIKLANSLLREGAKLGGIVKAAPAKISRCDINLGSACGIQLCHFIAALQILIAII